MRSLQILRRSDLTFLTLHKLLWKLSVALSHFLIHLDCSRRRPLRVKLAHQILIVAWFFIEVWNIVQWFQLVLWVYGLHSCRVSVRCSTLVLWFSSFLYSLIWTIIVVNFATWLFLTQVIGEQATLSKWHIFKLSTDNRFVYIFWGWRSSKLLLLWWIP